MPIPGNDQVESIQFGNRTFNIAILPDLYNSEQRNSSRKQTNLQHLHEMGITTFIVIEYIKKVRKENFGTKKSFSKKPTGILAAKKYCLKGVKALEQKILFGRNVGLDMRRRFTNRPTLQGSLYIKSRGFLTTCKAIQARQKGITGLESAANKIETVAQLKTVRAAISKADQKFNNFFENLMEFQPNFAYSLFQCNDQNRLKRTDFEIYRVGQIPQTDQLVPAQVAKEMPFTRRENLGINANLRTFYRLQNQPNFRVYKEMDDLNSKLLSVPEEYTHPMVSPSSIHQAIPRVLPASLTQPHEGGSLALPVQGLTLGAVGQPNQNAPTRNMQINSRTAVPTFQPSDPPIGFQNLVAAPQGGVFPSPMFRPVPFPPVFQPAMVGMHPLWPGAPFLPQVGLRCTYWPGAPWNVQQPAAYNYGNQVWTACPRFKAVELAGQVVQHSPHVPRRVGSVPAQQVHVSMGVAPHYAPAYPPPIFLPGFF